MCSQVSNQVPAQIQQTKWDLSWADNLPDEIEVIKENFHSGIPCDIWHLLSLGTHKKKDIVEMYENTMDVMLVNYEAYWKKENERLAKYKNEIEKNKKEFNRNLLNLKKNYLYHDVAWCDGRILGYAPNWKELEYLKETHPSVYIKNVI